jgi:hypothetical protein
MTTNRWKWLLDIRTMVAVAGVMVASVALRDEGQADVLRASRFEVVGEAGNVCASIGAVTGGTAGYIRLLGPDGVPVAGLGTNVGGNGQLFIRSHKGGGGLLAEANSEGAFLNIYDINGKPRLGITVAGSKTFVSIVNAGDGAELKPVASVVFDPTHVPLGILRAVKANGTVTEITIE